MPYSKHKITTCSACGKQRERKFHEKHTFLCDERCKSLRKTQLWREQHPLDTSPMPCGMCGKEFVPHPLVRYKAKYCSVPCKDKAKARSGREFLRRNPNISKEYHRRANRARKWRGNWWKALARDNFTCRICGKVGGENGFDNRSTVVHHLDGEGMSGAKNHILENLWTLCYDCHEGVHGVSLIQMAGKWYLSGKIFERLGLSDPPPLWRAS